jgi:hypothetical protein
MFRPRLDILPPPQRRLWPELAATPGAFTLYGGTAIALRLGHRESADFDFFSFDPFAPSDLVNQIAYLRNAEILRSSSNTLTSRIMRGGPVHLSFFGNLSLGRIEPPDMVEGPEFAVASLLDLAGLKAAVVTQRAEAKDYIDIHALLRAGIPLPTMIAAAAVIYEGEFNPVISLKALSYYGDAGLKNLPEPVKRDLAAAVAEVDLSNLPSVSPWRRRPGLT